MQAAALSSVTKLVIELIMSETETIRTCVWESAGVARGGFERGLQCATVRAHARVPEAYQLE